MAKDDHSLREIKYLPAWITTHTQRHLFVCKHCVGWVKLSCSAIMVLCSHHNHIPRDGNRRSRRALRGRVVKRFTKPVRVHFYDMKWGRALRLRRPLVDWQMRTLPFFYSEKEHFAHDPLTDREWMLATAILYFLEAS